VTPILVRPVREQLEHDRVIRLLQQRWRRKYQVGINLGNETTAAVVQGDSTVYPDVVLTPTGRPNKPEIVVEVETGESVNNLEAMAEWTRLSQLKAAFHLYIPAGSMERARRLCTEHNVEVAEICTYHMVGDQMRFTTVYKAPQPSRPARRPAGDRVSPKAAKARRPPGRRAASGSKAAKPAARQARPKKPAARPAARPKPKAKPAARTRKHR
jgi:hypothetical protein